MSGDKRDDDVGTEQVSPETNHRCTRDELEDFVRGLSFPATIASGAMTAYRVVIVSSVMI